MSPKIPSVKNPIPDTPVLNPRIPSNQFKAFCTTTIHTTVRKKEIIGNSAKLKLAPETNGFPTKPIRMPWKNTKEASPICTIPRKIEGSGFLSSQKLNAPKKKSAVERNQSSGIKRKNKTAKIQYIIPPGYGIRERFNPYRCGKSRSPMRGKRKQDAHTPPRANKKPNKKYIVSIITQWK